MITNLPANVAVATTYTVSSEVWSDLVITVNADNSLRIAEVGEYVTVAADAIPGLIAVLQDAAGLTPTPINPSDLPAFVIDGEGDHWYRDDSADTYTLGNRPDNGYRASRAIYSLLAAQTLDAIRERHGIKGEG